MRYCRNASSLLDKGSPSTFDDLGDFGTGEDHVAAGDGAMEDSNEKIAHQDEHQAYVLNVTTLPGCTTHDFSTQEATDFDAPPFANVIDDFDFSTPVPPNSKSARAEASVLVLHHQRQMEEIIKNPLQGMRGTKDPGTMAEIYQLGQQLGVSNSGGDQLLQFLRKYSCGATMYSRWKDLKLTFNKSLQLHVQELKIPLPEILFGRKQHNGDDITPVSCFYFNILDRLGEACLEIDPDDFVSNFNEPDLVKETRERIYNEFPKAELFQRFSVWTRRTKGSDAVPLLLAIYIDEANATSSRSAKPMIMFILNCTGKSFRPIFLGYCPTELPYSNEQLERLLRAQGTAEKQPSKASIKFAIRYAFRQATLRFITHVLQPVFDTAEKGILLQIGSTALHATKQPAVLHCFVHVACFNGDSKELHDLGSVSLFCKFCNCRQCTCEETSALAPEGTSFPIRNSSLMDALTKQLGAYQLRKFLKQCGKLVPNMSAEEKILMKKVEALGKKLGVIPGYNPLIGLWSSIEEVKVFAFYLALCIDYLHTVWKGTLEYAASWTLQTVFCISNFSEKLDLNTRFRGSLAVLDERIAAWGGMTQSLIPVPLVRLEKVSELIKCDVKSKKGQQRTTGIITSHFPAWQMRNLVLQLIFGIGCEGAIIPNTEIEFEIDCVDSSSSSAGKRRRPQVWRCNPTTIILNALVSVLDHGFHIEANEMRDSQVTILGRLGDNAHVNLVALHDMRRRFMRKAGILTPTAKITSSTGYELPRNIKCHSISHFPRQIRFFGADSSPYNTALGEKCNHYVVNIAFSSTSRVISSTLQEMACSVIRAEFSRLQSICVNQQSTAMSSSAETDFGEGESEGALEDADEWGVLSDDEGDDEGGGGGGFGVAADEGGQVGFGIAAGGVGGGGFRVAAAGGGGAPPHTPIGSEERIRSSAGEKAFISFCAVRKMGSVELCLTGTDAMLGPVKSSVKGIAFLHPLLKPEELYSLLTRTSKVAGNEQLCDLWNSFTKRSQGQRPQLFLCGGIRGDGNVRAGLKPFYMRATNSHTGNGRSRIKGFPVFNSVEVDYVASSYSFHAVEKTTFAKILANVLFVTKEKCCLYVALARLRQCKQTGRCTMPFDLYGFECTAQSQLSLDLIEVHSVKRPCFMVTSCDAHPRLRFESESNLKVMRWYLIPFDRAVKNDNCAYEDYAKYETAEGVSAFGTRASITANLARFGLNGDHSFSVGDKDAEKVVTDIARIGGGGGRALHDSSDLESASDSDAESDAADWDKG